MRLKLQGRRGSVQLVPDGDMIHLMGGHQVPRLRFLVTVGNLIKLHDSNWRLFHQFMGFCWLRQHRLRPRGDDLNVLVSLGLMRRDTTIPVVVKNIMAKTVKGESATEDGAVKYRFVDPGVIPANNIEQLLLSIVRSQPTQSVEISTD